MLRRTERRDRLVGLFVAGVVLLDPPLLNLVGGTVLGIPSLYLYLFAVWALLIVAVGIVMRSTAPTDNHAMGPPST